MSALKSRADGIISVPPAADMSTKRGYLVTLSTVSDVLTATLSASATVKAKGVVLEANRTSAGYATEKVTVGLLGNMNGTCRMSAGGTIAGGAFVQQDTDGQVVTDAESGARVLVGIALESGVAGDLIEVAPFAPLTLA